MRIKWDTPMDCQLQRGRESSGTFRGERFTARASSNCIPGGISSTAIAKVSVDGVTRKVTDYTGGMSRARELVRMIVMEMVDWKLREV